MASQPQDIDSILYAAVEITSPEERAAYLDEACGGDADLRAQVEKLLRAHFRAGSFLGRPVAGDRPTDVLNALTNPEGLPDAVNPPPDETSLDFLQPSDAPDSLGRLGQYEVREVVGRGGMGVVLKANDTKLNRIVAVKVLAPELASNAAARKRFVREARAAAAVSHHHVVTIYAVEEDRLPYLAMEFIDGQSLQEKIDRQGQLQLREILRIGQQIAAGLAAAHGQGIIHRDIKPANILLQNGIERVQITDFGLARAVDDVAITRPGEVAGTPQFMSPEQAQGQPVDHRSDLFSLGSVLYTMCTGRPPFRADTTVAVLRRICDDTARPIREVNPDVPEWLVEIVERLLAKQPEDRFETAAEVAELLGRHLAHVQDPGSTPFPGRLPAAERRPGGRARRRRFWLAAALILATLVAGLGLTEATGVTQLAASVIRVVTGEGTLVIEVDDPQVSITIDGEDLVITGAGPQEVRLKPGQYRVQAAKGGQLVKQELVTIQRGGRQVVRVALEPPVPAPASDAQRLDELSKLIEANPRDAGLLEQRGRLYAQLSRYDEAARDFIRANELFATPGGWDASSALFGSIMQHEEVFARIAELRPDDPEIWMARARVFEQLGDAARAEADFNKAVEVAGDKPIPLIERGRWYAQQGKQEQAGADFNRGIELAGADPIALIERGRWYAQQGEEEKAEADFARARSPGPGRRPALAAAPFSADEAAEHQRAWAEYIGAPVEFENSIGMKLRLIPPGMFTMGTPEPARQRLVEEMKRAGMRESEVKCVEEEGFVPVFLTEPFYVGKYEVTVGQFRVFVEDTGYETEVERSGEGGYAHAPHGGWVRHPSHIWKSPSQHWKLTDEQPVVHISWHDALAFCDWLSRKESRSYTLPSEGQWEFACRGGSPTIYGAGDDPAVLEEIAWNQQTCKTAGVQHAQPVGAKKANAFGLHDMLGNAAERCSDCYAPGMTGSVPLANPVGPTSANEHMGRGGKWFHPELMSRCGYRGSKGLNIDIGDGFRVLLKLDWKQQGGVTAPVKASQAVLNPER